MKKRFHYTWQFILLIALLSSVAVVNIRTNFYKDDRLSYPLFDEARLMIDWSVNPFGNEYPNYDKDVFLKYRAEMKVIDNYFFTEEFKSKYPEKIAIEDEKKVTRVFNDEDSYNNYLEENYQSLEEGKKQVTSYKESSQEAIVRQVKNSNLDEKDILKNGLAWIEVHYDNGKYQLTSNEEEIKSEKDSAKLERIKDLVAGKLQGLRRKDDSADFENIHDPFPIVEEAKIYYQIDFNNPKFVESLENSEFYENYQIKLFLSTGIAVLVALILTTFINYHQAKENRTFAFLTDIPIEIYGVLYLFIFASLGIGLFNLNDGYYLGEVYQVFKKQVFYQYAFAFFVALMAIIISVYMLLVLKSIYHEGLRAFVFEKSIIIRILKAIHGWLKRLLFNTFSNYGPTSKAFFIGSFLFFAIIGFLLTGTLGMGKEVFFIGLILLIAIFYLLHKYFIDLREIEQVAGQIAQGDYHIKIDESKNLFKKLSHYLNLTGDSLSLAIDKELKSERLKTELITNVSHDLKTPLTSIINYSQLASQEGAKKEDIDKYNKIILEKSLRLKDLIENLFEVSKVNSNNIELNITEINFSEMVKQMAGEWLDKLSEKNISLVSNIEDDIILNLDGQQSYRILDNIFSNIYKYALEGTRVYIDMIYDRKCTLKIKNISKYPLNISADELMERFTRGDASRSTEGSGLGLSIASSLTKIQGGKFDLEILGDSFMVEITF
ncbi:MAG: histidine kinase dimerization/phospho-acceptor domain-containing protein [Tissierellia bacterium]|nr:histidine kinase dimerization/phospho-acceptor domain-containing protein [Tissierellia bacterium]